MQIVKQLITWLTEKYRNAGRKGKMMIIVIILTSLCCLCSIPTAILSPSTPSPTLPYEQRESSYTPVIKSSSTKPISTDVILPLVSPDTPTVELSKTLEVHFIDVGQGDSILIRAPENVDILIDGGEMGAGAITYLKKINVDQLDLIILTHPDSDHLGGIVEILNTIPVKKVVTNGQSHTTILYENFIDSIANKAIEYSEVKRGVTLDYEDFQINFLNPVSIQDDNLNNNSLVFRLVFKEVSFLFTGDVQVEGELQMLADDLPLASTVLKVAHHGSQTGTTMEFLHAVHPNIAIYSSGLGNPNGSPNIETIANLEEVGAQVYGTDINGTIIIRTDGKNYFVSLEKEAVRSGEILVEPTVTDVIAPTITKTPPLSISLVSLTSPVKPGSNASLKITTAPGANCSITVFLKSGPSSAAGLGDQKAGPDGSCYWSWKIGSRTSEGSWTISIDVSLNGVTVTQDFPFEVRK